MRKACLILTIAALTFGTQHLRSQSPTCSSTAQPVSFQCNGPFNQSCSFSVPGGGADPNISYIPMAVSCCGGIEYTYYDGGSCVIVTKNVDVPALQRLLEYSKTHQLLAATCNGQYYPAEALLHSPASDKAARPFEIHSKSLLTEMR